MLRELRLRGIGVVADALLPLRPGLTALTGETGAGKTMIVAGLGLLLGGRGDAGIVRQGQRRAIIEGRWETPSDLAKSIEELGGELDDGDDLISQRQVGANGRSRAMLGGVQVPIAVLGRMLSDMATIHGQSGQARLASLEHHREILDRFALPELLADYRQDYQERRRCAAKLSALEDAAAERRRETELLRFGLEEIAGVEPRFGEDHELAREATRLQDADGLKRLAADAQRILSGDEHDLDFPGAISLLDEARKFVEELSQRDDTASGLADRLRETSYILHDLAGDVASYAADLVSDPIRLEAVAERRAALADLTRKYGPELADVISWASDATNRLGEIDATGDQLEELRRRTGELDDSLQQAAQKITADRKRAAAELTRQVGSELAALAMPHARLEFQITEATPGPHGHDRVELMFTANPGAKPAPLAKVASGGELSRIRLALEVVLASEEAGHTFVFDEVDAGVGGAVGLEIGSRLRRLAARSQVIVVTHLPQVAAHADHHFTITKSSDGQVTTSDVRELNEDERALELSRMMSGSKDSAAGLEHAVELLTRARAGTG